jgi:hypothetical protein
MPPSAEIAAGRRPLIVVITLRVMPSFSFRHSPHAGREGYLVRRRSETKNRALE